MFENLIASRPKRQKTAGETALSVVLHGVLIFAAVKATAAAPAKLREIMADTTMVFLKPPEPADVQLTDHAAAAAAAAAASSRSSCLFICFC